MLCHHEIWHFAKVPHESVFYCRFNYFAIIRSLNTLTFQSPLLNETGYGCILQNADILPCKRGIHWWWWGEENQSCVTESRKKKREHRKQKYLSTNPIWVLVREMIDWQAEEKILLSICRDCRMVRTKKNPVYPFPLPCVPTAIQHLDSVAALSSLCEGFVSLILTDFCSLNDFFPRVIKSPRAPTSKILCKPLQNRC